MKLTLLSGSANRPLAETVADKLGVPLASSDVQRFPDGEIHVEVHDSVRGQDVYLLQPTCPPIQEHLLELLLLADACRRSGAARLTAVMSYFAYARQDRRAHGREAVGARVVADLLRVSGLQRIVAVDLHTAALEGFFSVPVEHLTAVPLLAEAARPSVTEHHVLVAPDIGAVKLAERYARLLHLPIAIVHKVRVSGEQVRALGITGAVKGRAPLIVDDMISTGGTIEAAIENLLAAGCRREVTLAATHALLVRSAADRLAAQPVQRCIVTDSVSGAASGTLLLEVVSLAPLLADAIRRLHTDQSLGDLIAHA